MALELAPKVRVCAVAPGYVLTPMQRAEYSDAMLEEVNRKVPMGRHASPEEIAGLFAYLASDDAAYVTGTGVYDGRRRNLRRTGQPLARGCRSGIPSIWSQVTFVTIEIGRTICKNKGGGAASWMRPTTTYHGSIDHKSNATEHANSRGDSSQRD